jgi:hypothetical protein
LGPQVPEIEKRFFKYSKDEGGKKRELEGNYFSKSSIASSTQ